MSSGFFAHALALVVVLLVYFLFGGSFHLGLGLGSSLRSSLDTLIKFTGDDDLTIGVRFLNKLLSKVMRSACCWDFRQKSGHYHSWRE